MDGGCFDAFDGGRRQRVAHRQRPSGDRRRQCCWPSAPAVSRWRWRRSKGLNPSWWRWRRPTGAIARSFYRGTPMRFIAYPLGCAFTGGQPPGAAFKFSIRGSVSGKIRSGVQLQSRSNQGFQDEFIQGLAFLQKVDQGRLDSKVDRIWGRSRSWIVAKGQSGPISLGNREGAGEGGGLNFRRSWITGSLARKPERGVELWARKSGGWGFSSRNGWIWKLELRVRSSAKVDQGWKKFWQ